MQGSDTVRLHNFNGSMEKGTGMKERKKKKGENESKIDQSCFFALSISNAQTQRDSHTPADRLTHTKTVPLPHHDPDELKLSLDLHLNQERMRTDKNRTHQKIRQRSETPHPSIPHAHLFSLSCFCHETH